MSPYSADTRVMEQHHLLSVASVSCTALRKSYDAELGGHRWRHAVLSDLSLAVRARRCTAIVGAGLGPVTVLRCLAGLVTPERGSIVWRAYDGRLTAAPPRRLVAAGWRPYACQSVADVLQAAVPPGHRQSAADHLVSMAARRCALTSLLGKRVLALPAANVRLIAIAAAIVAGARWLLLDQREAVDVLNDDASAGSIQRAGNAQSRNFPTLLEAAVLGALADSGFTIVIAGPAPQCAPFAPAATIALSRGRLAARPELGMMRRVAERQPDVVTAAEIGSVERTAGSTVVAPVATASGSL